MKKFLTMAIFICSAFIQTAEAQHMLKEESYLAKDLIYSGVPDYPPFSEYTQIELDMSRKLIYESAFLKPVQKIAEKYKFKIEGIGSLDMPTLEQCILDIRSGETQLFFGAYSNTKLFTGIELIYPASVSNPIHVITLPETQEKIKSTKDLAAMKGVVSKSEYFSDFVLRKIKPLNITYVETPYKAYEALFTGEADYILGGMYYNRIMASRYGIEQYLAFSTKPLFKIPTFIALSKLLPQMSLYEKDLSTEFSKPEFGNEVKKEILRIVENEITKNQGIVPPAFAKKAEQKEVFPVVDTPGKEESGGKIIEQKIEEKSFDKVLDGI